MVEVILAIGMQVLSPTPAKMIYEFETRTMYLYPQYYLRYTIYIYRHVLPLALWQVSERLYRSKIRNNGMMGSKLCLI